MFSLNIYLQYLLSSNFKFLWDNKSLRIFIKKAIFHRKELCCLSESRNYHFRNLLGCTAMNTMTYVKSQQSFPRAEQINPCKPWSEQVLSMSKLQVKIPVSPVAVSILFLPLTNAWNTFSFSDVNSQSELFCKWKSWTKEPNLNNNQNFEVNCNKKAV